MSRLAALLAALAAFGQAKERATLVEVPKTSPISVVSPALALPLAPVNAGLELRGFDASLAAGAVPRAAHAPEARAQDARKTVAPRDLALAPSALAPSAFAPAAQAPVAVAPEAVESEDAEVRPASAESAWTAAAALFDKYVAGAPVPPDPGPSRAAIDAARRGRWGKAETEAVVREAELVFARSGTLVERIEADERPALRVVAKKGVSELNDLAFEAGKAFGVTLDYVPSRTHGASAGYRDVERRVMLSGPHNADFRVALLHELRHAWYSSLVRRGIIRLFHFQMVARPGLAVSRAAESYAGYVSLEELSNYPKTLKHMIVEILAASPERRAELEPLAVTRAYQLFELLRTAAEIFETAGRIDERAGLDPYRLAPRDYEGTALKRVESLDLFRQDMPRGWLFYPSPKRPRRVLGFSAAPAGSAGEAEERLRLAAKIMTPLLLELAPRAAAYRDAAKAEDWNAAGAAADKMIALVARAEKDWLERQPSR